LRGFIFLYLAVVLPSALLASHSSTEDNAMEQAWRKSVCHF